MKDINKANAMRLKSRGRFKKCVAWLPLTLTLTTGLASIGAGLASIPIAAKEVKPRIDAFTSSHEFLTLKLDKQQEILEKFKNDEISFEECNSAMEELESPEFVIEAFRMLQPEEAAAYEKADNVANGLLITMVAGAMGVTPVLGMTTVLLSNELRDLISSGKGDIAVANRYLDSLLSEKKDEKDLREVVEDEIAR